MTKYFIDVNGNYIGGFDGATPPEGSIEVAIPPDHGLDRWDGKQWITYKIPDLESFVTQVVLDPIFSDREVMQVQQVSRILSPAKRDLLIVQLLAQAAPDKQQRLLELAAQYNIPLPPLGGQ